jgi:FkbH-like protein
MIKNNISIANTLRNKQHEIAEIYANALYLSPRWVSTLDSAKNNWKEFLCEQFYAYVDYLALYFEFNDETYKNLYLGEKLKSLHAPDLDAHARHLLAITILDEELKRIEVLLKSQLGIEWENFSTQLVHINKLITTETKHQLNVAFVGDCLFLDILPFIIGPLNKEGISINAEYIASKNPLEVREELKKISSKKLDLIFFSPFTYDFTPNLVVLQEPKNGLLSKNKIIKHLESNWVDIEKTIEVASDLFDCPIYVHNASLIIRDENSVKRFIKLKLTKNIRDVSKKWIHEKINECIEKINKKSFSHLFLFDELKHFESISEFKAGSLLYSSKLQHPSVLGMVFAKQYIDIIYACTIFRKKKIVVCDLDNTLWEGVIGEGSVQNYHDRQKILKRLRNKGVVLAINSKNDPKNVHWTNATLSENDFVYEAINWQPKVQNMSKIPDELNLKINSFIFIDDRTDEIELMKSAFPEVLCLNATESKTWERLDIWAHTLEDDQEMDRTLMYQQREKRKEFVKEEVTTDEERYAMFSSLELTLHIKKPEENEIKRVTELINRTNQFNLEGMRVSLKDMTNWFNNEQYIILAGRTSDRFGDMGVTCVTVGQYIEKEFRIIAFVLSCRVFGYHFEHSVMNHLKYLAKKAGAESIRAKYVATAVNAPCKDFLKYNGFIEKNGYSYFDLSKDITVDAPWIKVKLN